MYCGMCTYLKRGSRSRCYCMYVGSCKRYLGCFRDGIVHMPDWCPIAPEKRKYNISPLIKNLVGKPPIKGVKFSILICSLHSRVELLRRLLIVLKQQTLSSVEILVDVDNGEISTGAKRNRLLQKAQGTYVAFVDDDDMVSNDYVSKILNAVQSKPDVVGMTGMLHNANGNFLFYHSLAHKKWYKKDGAYYRNPNHLDPVKRELALQIGFPDWDSEEDKDYSKRLLPLLKTEQVVEGIIYYYLTR